MTEREIYKKFSYLSEHKLNTKSNKNIYEIQKVIKIFTLEIMS